MSVYRNHKVTKETLYRKLNEIINKIKERYQNPMIIIGGDINDTTPPE